MKEWNAGMSQCKNSLMDFVRTVKIDKFRKKKLEEDLEWVNHLFFTVSGPIYDRIGGSTNVKPDKMIILLDRKDKIERKLKAIEDRKIILDSFLRSLTDKEKHCFKLFYFKELNQRETANIMKISQQAVSQKLMNIEKKWNLNYKDTF